MTVALLNTKGFQYLKYCMMSKGFLEHLEYFYIPQFMKYQCSIAVKLQIPTVSGSTHAERCDCFVIFVYNVRSEMLLPV